MKIICIAWNYADHTKELDNTIPSSPVFFIKPDTALLRNNQPFYYPDFTKNLHYETELIIRINKVGRSIEEKYARRYYNEIGIGIDFTARDIQRECRENGQPWTIAKAFDFSAPISPAFISVEHLGGLSDINFHMKLNGVTVQKGNSSDMIFNVDKIISYVSQFMTLKIGDLIFTGTPAGIGPVKIDDRIQAYINNELLLDFEIK
ncbi:MAG: fumarylacetoacetate hydrolase family protein [Prevotellaceae bacterium]|jgi:2-keto-4-pentenoate hydratase/2-oxohepta-3-ene-1,7-dioic acid hydratase in catechol pathway|nr:fumarylacetoacetate hydrolase family protein [Prevotellaceae bacterium]